MTIMRLIAIEFFNRLTALVIVTSYFSQIVTELVTELHHYKSN